MTLYTLIDMFQRPYGTCYFHVFDILKREEESSSKFRPFFSQTTSKTHCPFICVFLSQAIGNPEFKLKILSHYSHKLFQYVLCLHNNILQNSIVKNIILLLIAFYKIRKIFKNISYLTQFYKFVIFTSSFTVASL